MGEAAPKLYDLGQERGLSPRTLELFNVRVNGTAWLYDTKCMDGTTATRRKSFYSTAEQAPVDEQAGWSKYTWHPKKPEQAKYFYPPGLKLMEEIEKQHGALWIVGGDIASMTMIEAGIYNTISTFGDSNVPDSLVDDLKRWGAKLVFLVPDRDKSGQRWAVDIRDMIVADGSLMLIVFELPYELTEKHGKDVNDYWLEQTDKLLFKNALEALKEWVLPEPEIRERQTTLSNNELEVPAALKIELRMRLGVVDKYNNEGWSRKNVNCPFHEDNHASATWNDDSAILYCHGPCGRSFLVRELCEYYGIRMGDYYRTAPEVDRHKDLPAEKPKEPLHMPTRHEQQYAPKLPPDVQLSDEQLYEARKGRVWLDKYVKWCKDGGPLSPDIFYEAMGLWTLSMAATRRMKVQIGNENIFPNLYVFIVATTTVYRKSTALAICNQFIEHAKMDFLKLPERATPEALFEFLAGKLPSNSDSLTETERQYWRYGRTFSGQRAIMEDEASALLSEMRKDYMAGLSELLLKGYDGQGVLRKLLKSQGLITVRDMCLSFLGATTPVEWGRRIGNEERQNGFVARFAVITPEGPPIWAEALEVVEPPIELVKQLRYMFREVLPWDERCIRSADGQPMPLPDDCEVIPPPVTTVTIAPDAFVQIQKYRRAMSFDMLTASGMGGEIGDDKAPSYARLGTMVVKVAMLLAAVESTTKQIRIETHHAYAAQQVCERWRESYHRLDIHVAQAKVDDVDERVLNFVRSSGAIGVTVRDVVRSCGVQPTSRAKEQLATLVDAGELEAFKREPIGGKGRPAICYRAVG